MVGFLWKGEREMKRQDKLSVLLMLGILCLVLVNAGAIYHMWLNGEGRLAEMKGCLLYTSNCRNTKQETWTRLKLFSWRMVRPHVSF